MRYVNHADLLPTTLGMAVPFSFSKRKSPWWRKHGEYCCPIFMVYITVCMTSLHSVLEILHCAAICKCFFPQVFFLKRWLWTAIPSIVEIWVVSKLRNDIQNVFF